MNYDLLVIGDCAIDEYMQIETTDLVSDPDSNTSRFCFFHGSKIPVKTFKATPAGNACHVSIGGARLGLKTAVYTELGNDDNGNKIIDTFANNGVDTSFCIKNDASPTNVHAIISFKNERTIFSYHEPRDYKMHFKDINPAWIYYSSLADGFEGFQADLLDYLEKKPDTLVAFNPGSLQLKVGVASLQNILQRCDVLFVNKQEAYSLIQKDLECNFPLRELHEKLHLLGPKLSVITNGKHGSSVFDGTDVIEVPAPAADFEIIDKTGSGDAYATGFISALFYKKTLSEAVMWANANALATMKYIGGVDGLLNLEEMQNATKNNS